MVGLGATALVVAGIIMLWQQEPPQPLSQSGVFSSSKVLGTSALSHGGPSPSRGMAAGTSTAHFHIGQRLIVASAENVPRIVTLLASVPDSTDSPNPSVETRTLSPGHVMIVSGMRLFEPPRGLPQHYYELTFPDGGKGWLADDVLRLTTK
jgi:hypothetical protein